MPKELPKIYEPQKVEAEIYKRWEESGFFNPDKCISENITKSDAKPFSMVLPPPNVTGRLHTGHAAMLAIQDIFARYHRMKGERTLWLPGTDHAAIATQSKVEQLMFERNGKTRHDLGREAFLKEVEKFAQESHDTIVMQTKKMGASLDWSREAFTLDEKRSLAVRTAFKKMYDDGMIYRGHRIVNWDPKLKTTVSDDELEHKEESVTLYYLQYGPFVISTARPETKFGDKYVVVHPEDERYKQYKHGQELKLEWINGPVVATVIKDDAIDMSFGTGAMTITPWHDMVDFDIAERHKLAGEQIIDFDSKLLPVAGEFAGMDIRDARKKIVAKLEAKGLVVKKEDNYLHNIAINSRGEGIIEPQIKEQWFIAVNKEFERAGKKTTLKKLMREAVDSGKIEIVPDHFKKIYFHWIDNLRDWCISRQIWYGHRIPVWYKGQAVYCGLEMPEGNGWEQDPDTLDTWFSSGLWTFSTLGWPENTDDLKIYHPTSILETGYDILFFWVARMILMTTYLINDIPFKTVYLHGLVRDEQGRKMSKSLGNIIDPLDVIEKYGTDAVRLSFILGSAPGQDMKLGEEKIASFRNFSNKLWNISRYCLSQENFKLEENISPEDILSAADHWIIGSLDEHIAEINRLFENKQISITADMLKSFTWYNFADQYVEWDKIGKNKKVLGYVLDKILRLWHPFMPFITEHIWALAGQQKFLMISQWPQPSQKSHDESARNFSYISGILSPTNNIRAEYKVETTKKILLFLDESAKKIISDKEILFIQRRAGVSEIKFGVPQEEHLKRMVPGLGNIYIPLEGLIDIEKETAKAKKEIENIEKFVAGLKSRLKDKAFVAKAPSQIIAAQKETLAQKEAELAELKKHLASLK
jgi:valyl-tRNA synthetase